MTTIAADVTTVTAAKLNELIAAITSPNYQHSRARGGPGGGHGGGWVTYVYHRDLLSPSGVMCAARGDSSIVDPLIRALRNNSPLSPTEGLGRN
jgi:hypothetical protein